jgi:hypothetical protein
MKYRVRLDALMSMMTYALAPSPLHVMTSASEEQAITIKEAHFSKLGEMLVYNIVDQEIKSVSSGWRGILTEYYNRGPVFQSYLNDMSSFMDKVPYDMWWLADKPKRPILPPVESISSDMNDMLDAFRT